MDCQRFNSEIIDYVRGTAAPDASFDLEQHASGCERCTATLQHQQTLSAALTQLKVSEDRILAPSTLELRLKAARLQQPNPAIAPLATAQARRINFSSLRAAAVAAAVLLTAGLLYVLNSGDVTPLKPAPVTRFVVPEKPAPQEALAEIIPAAAKPKAKPDTAVNVTKTQPVEEEYATDFFPLYSTGYSDTRQLMRVKMEREALLKLGFPVSETRMDEPVVADIVLGDDGVPQAIRFIQNASY